MFWLALACPGYPLLSKAGWWSNGLGVLLTGIFTWGPDTLEWGRRSGPGTVLRGGFGRGVCQRRWFGRATGVAAPGCMADEWREPGRLDWIGCSLSVWPAEWHRRRWRAGDRGEERLDTREKLAT
jgi:hypothetical protein